MMFFKYILLILVFYHTATFSQNVIKHRVKTGESIYSLAKKYDVKVADIYELNPKLKGSVLGLNTVVSIPKSKSVKEEMTTKIEKTVVVETKRKDNENNSINQAVLSHVVKQKETLYSIAKKYGVTMENICEMNPELKTADLKVGALLIMANPNYIPPTKEEVKSEIKTEPSTVVTKTESIIAADVTHKVQPKETLFKISKKYDVTVAELQKLNPNLPSGLPVGYILIVKKATEVSQTVTTTTTTVSEKTAKEIEEEKALAFMYSSKANYLIAKASENLGTPYRSGGITSAGFDCSGLMFTTFKNIDMILPRSSYEMANYGKKIDKSIAQKGDLIFFATFGRGRVSHVGMITEILDDEIKFIHSSTQAGVIISSTKEDYYAKSFVQINRVLFE